ncbi:MAG TPA: phytanoyl-CoA dioxygenase family protein [Chthoniobacterales bacterium]|jgi:hypothetical protein
MLTPTPLTEDQIRQYNEEGWCMLGKVMDDATIEALRAEEVKFRTRPLYYDSPKQDVPTLFRSQMSAYSEPVRNFGMTGPHLSLVEQVLGSNLCWIYTQFVTKFPDKDLGKSEFPWHQDNGYGLVEPANNMTIWIPLDDVDEKNGCVWISPKSHLNGVLPHGQKSADSWHLEVPVQGDGIPAIMKAGEAVAFTGLTLHRSKLNHTDQARRAFFMQYVDANGTFGKDRTPIVDKHLSYVVRGAADYEKRPPTPAK